MALSVLTLAGGVISAPDSTNTPACATVGALKPRATEVGSATSVPAARDAAAEQNAYLAALRGRLTGSHQECFPDDLPDAEKDRIIAENSALPPSLFGFDEPGRFFTASTIWTGDGQQGPSAQAIPAHLTYSFPSDGVLWGVAPRPVVPNDFNSGLAHVHGGANPDFGRELVRQAFAGWRRFSGLRYTEVADDNSQHDSNVTRVSTRGDLRVGAGFAWPDSYLAYNFFPTSGSDMFNNSRYWEGNFFARPDNSWRYFRNVEAHEHGHGNGSIHVVPCNQVALMEPFISVAYDQHQIDDIRNVNRGYGDRLAGNNSAGTAFSLGSYTPSAPRAVVLKTLSTNGVDGPNDTDEDWFTFTVSGGPLTGVIISVTPTGGQYVNGQQSGGCSGTTNTVDASAAGNLSIELRNMGGANVIASATGAAAGAVETLNAPSLANGTYHVRVFDQGPNDPVNQILQTYDLSVRRGTANAPPTAIAGVNKRIGTNTTCFFLGDINSYTNQDGATLTTFDWDLDGNGSFETTNNPRPSTVYTTAGVRTVTLRVTDSNGQTGTDSITVDVFSEPFAVFAVQPYPIRNAQGTSVPITIFGKGFAGITLGSLSISGTGVTLSGAPVVTMGGTQITGVSANVAANAPKGARVITVQAPGSSSTGRATFYLYPLTPAPFSITSPANGSTTANTTPVVSWSSSEWAAQYFVQIATDNTFGSGTVVASSPSTLIDTAWQTPIGALSTNTTYFARVRARNETGSDTFAPTISFTTGGSSINNDDCANAITVLAGATPFNNANSSTDGPDDAICESGGSFIQNDVWYRYLATCDGELTVGLCGATFDTMLAVYDDSNCPVDGNLVACDDDACSPASLITTPAINGKTYYIRIGGWFGSTGSGIMTIACTPTCPGDANGDGVVNLADIALITTNWTAAVPPGTSGDLSGNGVIGLEDLAIVIQNWGTSCS